jgi:hypothetical protein
MALSMPDLLASISIASITSALYQPWLGHNWPVTHRTLDKKTWKGYLRPNIQGYIDQGHNIMPSLTSLYGTQSTQRVAMATFWRTFHHDGKISPLYVPAERANQRVHKGVE